MRWNYWTNPNLCEWISIFIPCSTGHMITYPCWNLSCSALVKWAPLGTWLPCDFVHYIDIIMTTVASQITSLTVVYSTVYSDADQRKHQSSASLAFVRGIHRDRWIPRTKGQLRGKCLHLMTSSWFTWEYHLTSAHIRHPAIPAEANIIKGNAQHDDRNCTTALEVRVLLFRTLGPTNYKWRSVLKKVFWVTWRS